MFIKKIYYIALSFLSLIPQAVFASKIKPLDEDFGLPTTGGQGLPFLIGKVITYAANIIATVAVVALVYAAFSYMMAGGDEEKAKKAKMMIVWTLVGLLIAIFSWSFVNIFLGLEPFKTAPAPV
ncbi:MAG: hypothetical protein PHU71_00485 [Candidatus Gracilibacteria bacterium]|nr:hypothetical protein [Candidatus Gracilibacteria bacterium]